MTTLAHRAALGGPRTGGVAARRALIRWAGRMFRREWRQQLLVVILLTVAVTAAIGSITIVYNTAPADNAEHGSATNLLHFDGSRSPSARGRARLRARGTSGRSRSSATARWRSPAASRLSTSARRTPTARSAASSSHSAAAATRPDRTRSPSPTGSRGSCGSGSARPWRSTPSAEPSSGSSRTRASSATSSPSSLPRRPRSPDHVTALIARERRRRSTPSHRQRQGARGRNLRSGGPGASANNQAANTLAMFSVATVFLLLASLVAAAALRGRRTATAPPARHARGRWRHTEAPATRAADQRRPRRDDRRARRDDRRPRTLARPRPDARVRDRPSHRPAQPPVGAARDRFRPRRPRRDRRRLVAGTHRRPPPRHARAVRAAATPEAGSTRRSRGRRADRGRDRLSRAVGARQAAADRRRDRGDDPRLPAPGPARRSASSRAWPGGSRSRRAWRCATSSGTRPAPAPRSRRSHSRSASRATAVVITSAEEAKEAAQPPNLSDRQIRVHIGPPESREAIPANARQRLDGAGRSRRAARRPTRRGGSDPAPEGHPTGRAGLLRARSRHPACCPTLDPSRKRPGPNYAPRGAALRRHARGARIPRHRPRHDRTGHGLPGRPQRSHQRARHAQVHGSRRVLAVTNVQPIETGRHLLGAPGDMDAARVGVHHARRPSPPSVSSRSRPAGSSSRAGR